MLRSIYYPERLPGKGTMAAAARKREKEKAKDKLCSFANFNPLALLSFILLFISITLMAIALGLDQWSEQRVRRGSGATRLDSATYKTQGFSRRCIQYVLSDEVEQNLPSEQLPRNSCLAMGSVSCQSASSYLESGHDLANVDELQNTDNTADCREVRAKLLLSFSLTVIGIVVAFVAMVIMFPTWNRLLFLIGAGFNMVASILFAVVLGVSVETDRDYAGFFSLNGQPNSGCWGISFGLFIGSFAVSIISMMVAVLAFCYRFIEKCRNKKSD